MYTFLQLALLAMGCSFFFIKRPYKIAMLFVVMLLFNAISLPGIGVAGKSAIFLPCCFFLSEFKHWRTLRPIRGTIIYKILVIQAIAAVIAYINSPLYFGKVNRTLSWCAELLSADIVIGYIYYAIRNKTDLLPVVKTACWCMAALTLLGAVNLLLHSNPYLQTVAENSESEYMIMSATHFDDNYIRFRVQSFFTNPFDYGYVSLVMLYFFTFCRYMGCVSRKQFVAMMACCMFGILTCGCRTIYMICMLSALIFVLYNYDLMRRMRIVFVSLFVGLFAYCVLPPIQELADKTFSIFTDTKGERVEGSSLQMRGEQLAAVVLLTSGEETLGLGRGYFSEELDWGSENFDMWELRGLEGLYLSRLLERGIVGLLLWVAVYVMMLHYFYRHRHAGHKAGLLGFITIFSYIMFSNMTGELSSLFPTAMIAGIAFTFTPPPLILWAVINRFRLLAARHELKLAAL